MYNIIYESSVGNAKIMCGASEKTPSQENWFVLKKFISNNIVKLLSIDIELIWIKKFDYQCN